MLNGVLPASWQGHTHAALRIMAGLLFLYYSSAIFLLGAEVTAAFYRHETGAQTIPKGLKIPAELRGPRP